MLLSDIFHNKFDVSYTEKSADQQHDIRFVGVVSGCYSFSNRIVEDTDVTSVFACRTKCISTKTITLDGPVRGQVGEPVSVKLDGFDIVRGTIVEVTQRGFTLEILASEEECTKIAGTIDWIKKNKFRSVKDKRDHKRTMLPEPCSAITLGDGRIVECFIIDVSTSGAAVSADMDIGVGTSLAIGTPLAVGSAIGKVARKLEIGFAIEFISPLDMENLDEVFAWSLPYLEAEA